MLVESCEEKVMDQKDLQVTNEDVEFQSRWFRIGFKGIF